MHKSSSYRGNPAPLAVHFESLPRQTEIALGTRETLGCSRKVREVHGDVATFGQHVGPDSEGAEDRRDAVLERCAETLSKPAPTGL